LIRTRIQQSVSRETVIDTIKRLRTAIKSDGVFYLWRGLEPSLLRDIPFSAIYWFGYEKLKKLQYHGDSELSMSNFAHLRISFTSGALSGMVAAFSTTPFDVAKTRRQMEISTMYESSIIETSKEKSVIKLLRMIYSKEGLQGLFKGSSVRIIKIAPSSAIMVSVYEMGKRFLTIER
jgi:solute carrier family 25, member 39/40